MLMVTNKAVQKQQFYIFNIMHMHIMVMKMFYVVIYHSGGGRATDFRIPSKNLSHVYFRRPSDISFKLIFIIYLNKLVSFFFFYV